MIDQTSKISYLWLKNCSKLCKPSERPRFPLSLFRYKINTTTPTKTKPQESHFDSYQPIMGKTGSHCPSTSRRTCPAPWNRQKQEPQRQVPVTYTAKADGVPSHSGSLRVPGIHLPTPGQCGDSGSELAKAMLAIWRCKLPVGETLALTWWLRHWR